MAFFDEYSSVFGAPEKNKKQPLLYVSRSKTQKIALKTGFMSVLSVGFTLKFRF